jgi:hypothetical protein
MAPHSLLGQFEDGGKQVQFDCTRCLIILILMTQVMKMNLKLQSMVSASRNAGSGAKLMRIL